jgi:hypothetical protein
MDNCSGQNKNQMVLRLVPYLVEVGHFSKVNFIFLVVGHTKNPCDRLFNLCKKAYRKSQVFIMDQLVDASNDTTHVSGCRVSADIMKDYQKFFDLFYRNFTTPKILKWQIFTCSTEGAMKTTIILRASDLPNAETTDYEMGKQVNGGADERAVLMATELETLPAPGLKEIKQVELYTKYRPLVPEEYRPKPSDEVLKRVANRRVIRGIVNGARISRIVD